MFFGLRRLRLPNTMHSIEITGREFDILFCPNEGTTVDRLRQVGKRPVCLKIPLEILNIYIFLDSL